LKSARFSRATGTTPVVPSVFEIPQLDAAPTVLRTPLASRHGLERAGKLTDLHRKAEAHSCVVGDGGGGGGGNRVYAEKMKACRPGYYTPLNWWCALVVLAGGRDTYLCRRDIVAQIRT
jgi:hypothetical protein